MFTAPDARADNECGPPEREVVCSPSTYDPAQGNIFYSHDENGMDETTSDLFIRLAEDLSINYDRERPGDDVYTSPYDNRVRFNNAVWIAPGEFGEYAGDVSLYSSADIASNARGIFAGHYGKSGALHMEVSGGEITTTGEVSHAVRGFRFDGSDGALDLIVRGVSIDTTGNNADGVSAAHWGQGVLNLIAQDSAVTTEGDAADGVYAFHAGAGDVNIAAKDLDITTKGDNAFGIVGAHESEGDLNLTARDSAVTTEGDSAYVVYALHAGAGDVNIAAKDLDITTKGDNAFGVVGAHENEGDLNLTARDSAVTTEGDSAYVVYARHEGAGDVNIATRGLDINTAGDSADGLLGWHQGTGELKMDVQDFAIETAGDSAHGLIGWHQGAGDLNITAQGVSITTAGEGARGIYGGHFFMEGDAAVRVHDSAISTAGAKAHGVYAFHTGAGVLEVDLRDMTIAATGAGADGIVSDHGGSGSAHMMIEGGSVHAAGAGASGVRMGRLAEDGTVSFAALVGEDGYRKQSVEVNAPVTGGSGENAAGVFLAGGGKVAIGPEGSVGAASGIAILASGGLPRLRVEMDLDGRWAGSVLQEGSIINDAGETTLVVNGVTLHEGATGATGAEVANGAWDLTLSETVQGRAFTPGDFIESYAPRAAVYEALPGSLLRLEGGRPSGRRVAQSGSPVWARISGRAGVVRAPAREHGRELRIPPFRRRGRCGFPTVRSRGRDRFGLAVPCAGIGRGVGADRGREDRGRGGRRLARRRVGHRRRLLRGRPRHADALRGGSELVQPRSAEGGCDRDGAHSAPRGGAAPGARRDDASRAAGMARAHGRVAGRLRRRGRVAGVAGRGGDGRMSASGSSQTVSMPGTPASGR